MWTARYALWTERFASCTVRFVKNSCTLDEPFARFINEEDVAWTLRCFSIYICLVFALICLYWYDILQMCFNQIKNRTSIRFPVFDTLRETCTHGKPDPYRIAMKICPDFIPIFFYDHSLLRTVCNQMLVNMFISIIVFTHIFVVNRTWEFLVIKKWMLKVIHILGIHLITKIRLRGKDTLIAKTWVTVMKSKEINVE